MKLLITSLALLALSFSGFSSERTIRFKGIVCTATSTYNGATPFLIINEITEQGANLILQMSDGIPDIREAFLDKIYHEDKLLVGYLSYPSDMHPYLANFSVYTDGSTRQDTKNAILTFEDRDIEIEMTCKDGMQK